MALLPVCLTVVLSLRCSTHIINQSEQTLSSVPVSKTYHLEILRSPSADMPTVAFSAFRVDTISHTVERKTTLGEEHETSVERNLTYGAGTLGIMAGIVAITNATDTSAFGYLSHDGRRNLSVVALTAVGVASALAVTRLISWLCNRERERIEHVQTSQVETLPCAVMTRGGDKELGTVHPNEYQRWGVPHAHTLATDCCGSFDLTRCIDSLPSDRDVDLTLTVSEAQGVSKAVTMPKGTVADIRKRELARREAARKAEEEARIEAERQQAEDKRLAEAERRKEEAKYRPLTLDAAIKQWKHFRTNEVADKGTVTTWRFKVSWVDADLTGYLAGFDYQVIVMGPLGDRYDARADLGMVGSHVRAVPIAVKNDWIVVTGAFRYISTDGAVVLDAIRVKNEGYRE